VDVTAIAFDACRRWSAERFIVVFFDLAQDDDFSNVTDDDD